MNYLLARRLADLERAAADMNKALTILLEGQERTTALANLSRLTQSAAAEAIAASRPKPKVITS